jgi:hypothetical protein
VAAYYVLAKAKELIKIVTIFKGGISTNKTGIDELR